MIENTVNVLESPEPRPRGIEAPVFTIESLAEKASHSVHESIISARDELYDSARRILKSAGDEPNSARLRFALRVQIDLRTGEVIFALGGTTKWRTEQTGFLEQVEMQLMDPMSVEVTS